MNEASTSLQNGHTPVAHIFRISNNDRPKLEKAIFKIIASLNSLSPSKTIEDAVKDITDKVLDGSLTVSPTKRRNGVNGRHSSHVLRGMGRKRMGRPKADPNRFASNFNPRTLAMVNNARANGPNGRRGSMDADSNSSVAQHIKTDKRRSIIVKKRRDKRNEKREERMQLLASKTVLTQFTGCPECELVVKFTESVQLCMLTFELDPLDAYYTVVTALEKYYSGTTWQANVNPLVAQFLNKILVTRRSGLADAYELNDFDFAADVANPEQQLRILRLQILLVFRSFLQSQLNDSQDQIIGKIADRLTSRPFDGDSQLNQIMQEVTDEFVDSMPRHISLMYDYMNLNKPVECETVESDDNEEDMDNGLKIMSTSLVSHPSLSDSINKSRSSSITNDNIFERFQKTKSPVSRRSSGEGPKYSDWVHKHQTKKRKEVKEVEEVVVKEEAMETECNGLEPSDDEGSDSSRLSPRKHASSQALRKQMSYIDMVKEKTRKAALLKKKRHIPARITMEEGQAYPRTSTPSLVYDSMDDDGSLYRGRDSVLTNGKHDDYPTPSEPLPRPKRRTLPTRQAVRHAQSSSTADRCNAPRKSLASPGTRGTVKRKASPSSPEPTAKRAPSFDSQTSDTAAYELPVEAVEVYKRHTTTLIIGQRKRKKEGDELFYSRGHVKVNVFDPPEEFTSKRNLRNTTVEAKSRSGRKVRGGEGVSHVANYLLNTLNHNPQDPVIPRNMARKLSSPFKLKRSLRLPSRSRSKQLKKMLACSVKATENLDASVEQILTATVSLPDLSKSLNMNGKKTIKTQDEKRLLDCLLSPRFYKRSPSKEKSGSRTCSESEDVDVALRRSPRVFHLNAEASPKQDVDFVALRSSSPSLI